MDWFFGLSGHSRNWFSDMVKVAVVSAKEKTGLTPYCLYDGPPCELIKWLESNEVKVINTAVPFRTELFSQSVIDANAGSFYNPENATGHFLRILVSEYSNNENILYTDCDVMFTADVSPPFISDVGVVREWNLNQSAFVEGFNSGVMIFNREVLNAHLADIIDYFFKNNFFSKKFNSYDQILLNEFYASKPKTFLDATYNWKPYQGVNEYAKIIHFQGPKPHRIKSILKGELCRGEEKLEQYVKTNEAAYAYYVSMYEKFLCDNSIKGK